MNQRLRNCTNSTNFDTVNCESYLPQLVPRVKSSQMQRFNRERSNANLKSSSAALVSSSALNSKSRLTRALTATKPNKPLLRQELLSNNSALVEVTVRTHAGKKPHNDTRQPWKELLKSTKSHSNFEGFDPLRTIHFLSKELHSKLKNISTGDPQLLEMIASMQMAVDRVPPDVVSATTLPFQRSKSEIRTYKSKLIVDNDEPPEKLIQVIKPVEILQPKLVNRSSQTHKCLTITDSEMFQKKLEASTTKLEFSCKQMEKLCDQLKNEKENLDELLQLETQKVAHLKHQLETLQNDKQELANSAFDRLLQDRNELEEKFKNYKTQMSAYHGPTIQELKTLVQDLQEQKMNVDRDNINLRHKLTSSDMEREKYITLLNMRDKQISEILNEMNCLQEVVSEQLVELQKGPVISTASSQSTVLENFMWEEKCVNIDHRNVHPKNLTSSCANLLGKICPTVFKELKSCSSTTTSESKKEKEPKQESHVTKNVTSSYKIQDKMELNIAPNIHDLFDKVKRQAMVVNLPQVPMLEFAVPLPCSSETSI
ncbi:hypothetical protein FQA39_LY07753 [Lamprigera yunnana]|nr:hypothetical protein FQA39_LY07753 [Lamprigera yunnana]